MPEIIGHCVITDLDTDEVLVDKHNAINYESMSYALALSLAGRPNGSIQACVFGNGASSVNAMGAISYLPPNVTGLSAQLYNQTYSQYVNDQSPLDEAPADNFLTVNHTVNTTYSDVVVTCLLDYNVPAGEMAFDNASQTNSTYTFDEIGLTTWNAGTDTGMLLTHVIFNPVQKALDRRISIVYTLRVVMS
jgi:hypothetical protein